MELAAVETHARSKPQPGCLDKEQAEAAAAVWLQKRVEASFFAQEQDTEGRCRRVCWSVSPMLCSLRGSSPRPAFSHAAAAAFALQSTFKFNPNTFSSKMADRKLDEVDESGVDRRFVRSTFAAIAAIAAAAAEPAPALAMPPRLLARRRLLATHQEACGH